MGNEWLRRPTHDGIWDMGVVGNRPFRVKVLYDNLDQLVYEHSDQEGFVFFFPSSIKWKYRFTGEDDWPVVPEDTQ